MTKTASSAPVHRLALRVREIGQLFNSMDPTPFLNKDLDPQANEFIESWASTHPHNSRFHLTIHLEQWPENGDPSGMLTEAIHNHFIYQAERTRRKFHQVLKQGRTSLVIGILFVSLCLIAADLIGDLGAGTMRRTKATLIYRRTKNLRAVQLLLGHSKLESTVRYLGIEVDDALEISEQTEI